MEHARWLRIFAGVVAVMLSQTGRSPTAAGAEELDSYRRSDYLGPCAVAAASDGATLYVACKDACQVLWISLPDGEVRQRITVPFPPSGLLCTKDGSELIVTCAAPESVILVVNARPGDAECGKVIRTISAGHSACSPVWDARRAQLYVCNRFDNNVSILDLPTGTEVAQLSLGREPITAALTPDGRTLLVANHLPDSRTDVEYRGRVSAVVWAISAQTHESLAIALPHGASSVRSLCITPDGAYALVTHTLSNFQNVPFRVDMGWINVNVVSIIDVRKQELMGTIGLDELRLGAANPWGVAISDGGTICVAASGTHELCVIDTAQLLSDRARRTMSPLPGAWPVYPSLGQSLWRRIALPGRGPRGVAVVGSIAYVTQYYSDTLAVVELDGSAAAVPRSIALGPTPQVTQQRRGQMLFDDGTICFESWQSCASCHPDARGDGLNWDLMNDGVGNPKSSKSMLLAHATPPAMAQGVRETAESAVRSGITHILFARRPEEEAAAIDAYLKTLEPVPSPYLVRGQLSEAAQRGKLLFESDAIGCHRCHPAPLYTDLKTHSIGKPQSPRFNNHFDTPTLVEVWRTAPYLSQGRYTSIGELLRDGRHGLNRGEKKELSEQEMNDLVEFVLSL
ncbi:MAG: hypothetical protein ACYC6N_19745 [Pirellulaceae bacterium]